jgi:N-carbamoyl-L-amino-acid hydrolase
MPKCDPARVLRDLKHLRSIGAYETGVHKPALSPEHMASIAYVKSELEKIGHRTVLDGIGNLIGFAPVNGTRLLAGSHLESQNHSGWLDGPLGVIYALEAARAIAADPAYSGKGVDVAAWCDEEGHFGSFLGSRSAMATPRATGRPARRCAKPSRPRAWPGGLARSSTPSAMSGSSRRTSSRATGWNRAARRSPS